MLSDISLPQWLRDQRSPRPDSPALGLNLIRRDVVEQLLEEHRARQSQAVQAEQTLAQLRKREASLERKQGDVFVMFEGKDALRILERLNAELEDVRSKIETYAQAAASVDFTADDLAQAIEAVIGDATKTPSERSSDDLRRLVRLLDVRIDLAEREDGRSIHVTGRISVPELSASVRA